ncbi:DNA-binding LacI/PurR family transcriptional regulator [Microbacterium terrae]|uniref:HTH-type transcriptional repressor CytR n=1 Tax=Microbacterium terrae TaxID=69369 RepID=A0A0M2GY11_9MICO|nr:LacI family DNA-binding transcriptional regulator [Microbacterium terrae]KJL38645.1 HTH-type transcriptional repressor CytR [Microbacterium terrae]MBP1076064.1 DNA-binding LacI/PurR family transcriptional regulator [Microbacterium terrae]GLJ96884.1 LacI family transcriptional regulator [Microbacterium terrae]
MRSGRPGGKVRLEDVANLAGVSMKTVSNVVHDHPHVSAKMRERVQSAIDQLGYRPNLTARRLATGRTGMLALAIPEIDQPYFAEIVRYVAAEAAGRGYRVIVEQTLSEVEAERAIISDREEGLVDGVIFHPMRIDTMEIARLRPDTPLVLLGEVARPLTTDHVMIDNVAAARVGVELLIAQGRSRIGFLALVHGDITESTHLRLLGYQEALVAAGMQIDPQLVLESTGWTVEEVMQTLLDALAAGIRFDAIVCRDDLFAMAAMKALDRAGLSVPGDVAVLGWDDTRFARYSTPAISSVSPDKAAIARTALDLLEERMNGYDGVGRHRIAPHAVVERETTAPK